MIELDSVKDIYIQKRMIVFRAERIWREKYKDESNFKDNFDKAIYEAIEELKNENKLPSNFKYSAEHKNTEYEYSIGDLFIEDINNDYEKNNQLFKPRNSYILDERKIVSIHKTPMEAIKELKKLNNNNLKVHWKKFNQIKEFNYTIGGL